MLENRSVRSDSPRSWRRAGVAMAFAAAAVVPLRMVLAVACPEPGSKVRVCITNPTADTFTAYVAGTAASNEFTCTGGSGPVPILGGYQELVPVAANGETCATVPSTGGLVSGMYVHRIYYAPPPTPGPSPTPRAAQYQKGPVVFDADAGGANPHWVEVDWTYHKTVFTVTSTLDSGCSDSNCQPGSCTLRQAVEKARLSSTVRPVLINFALPNPSTIVLDELGSACGQLRLTRAAPNDDMANVTIDGTNNSGQPWIVGDRSAAGATNFPVTVDLKNQVRFQITKHGNTIKGLHIKKTVPSGGVQANEVVLVENVPAGSGAANTLQALKLDGGNSYACNGSTPPCDGTADLINVNASRDVVVRNTEARSGLDRGIKAISTGPTAAVQVYDSWLHHSYRGNVQSSGSSQISVTDSVIEFAGRRISDNASVDPEAIGMVGNQGRINSTRNVIERNRAHGLALRTNNPVGDFNEDMVCGNGNSGIFVETGSTGTQINSSGVGLVFNGQRGVRLNAAISTIAPFAGSHAFVNNQNTIPSGCDFDNSSTTPMSPDDSQWTNGSPRKCGSGTVTITSVQDRINVEVQDVLVANPSNLFLAGQTVRVEGSGFNAVEGNTRVATCALGDDTSSNACCVRSPRESNTCDEGGLPPIDRGQCVRILDRLNVWHPMTVYSVSPTTIVTSLPTEPGPVFPCLGKESRIEVTKRTATVPSTGFAEYCTNERAVAF